MYIIDRTRAISNLPDAPNFPYPTETLVVVGTTGNVYTVAIERRLRCSCPSSKKDNLCKHLIYVLNRVLKADLIYCCQTSLTAQELCDIFAAAPPITSIFSKESSALDGHRKTIEGDCPICFAEFDEGSGKDEIVWCRAACGNNIHRHCFEQWAASSKTSTISASVSEVRCPFCRSQWQGDPDMLRKAVQIAKEQGRMNTRGYINVANQLGISTQRDTSTYHTSWVHRQMRNGVFFDEDGDFVPQER